MSRRHNVAGASIEIEIHPDLGTIESRWRALETDGICTPFQTFAWVSAVMGTLGRAYHAELVIAVAIDVPSRSPLMLLPLARVKRGLLTVLEPVDFGLADYNSPIIACTLVGQAERVRSIWAEMLRRLPPASFIHLPKLPATIGQRANPFISLESMRPETYSSWRLHLPDDADTLDAAVLSAPQRWRIRRKLKSVRHIANVVATSIAERCALFDCLRAQRRVRFRALRRADILEDPAYMGFYHRLLRDSELAPLVDVRALRIDGDLAAVILGLRHRDHYYFLLLSFDGAKSAISPGTALLYRSIVSLHAEGVRCFDFTIGDEAYKRRFKATEDALFALSRPLAPSGIPMALWHGALPRLVSAKRLAERLGSSILARSTGQDSYRGHANLPSPRR